MRSCSEHVIINRRSKLRTATLAALVVGAPVSHAQASDSYYTGEQVYSLQPTPWNHKEMGHIGPTGILAFVEVGVKVTETTKFTNCTPKRT
jgi:hypothetical protein